MDTSQHPQHFPMTKGALLFTAVVLLFIVLIVGVYLYYDLRLEQIRQTLQQLSDA